MGFQKKTGKGRIDKWYRLAKEKGYRARAAFKLIQLNRKYGFLEQSRVLLDLCAAPGSWCQVATENMPYSNSLIIGVDLTPIKPIPRAITLQNDITTESCRASLRQHLKDWKVDTVLHDGAPNVGTAWVQDAFSQAELVLRALKLATEFLVEGGVFVSKIFRSKDYNPLLWIFHQLFEKVEATKPPSSRNVSAEIFVVCQGFKAPKRIDPKLLDPKVVFEEPSAPAPRNEAKVFNPQTKKRKREGYEPGDYIQYKVTSAYAFIESADPIAVLGNVNELSFEQREDDDVALAVLCKLPETTLEVLQCCKDLKVLGKKEFRTLLRWRLRVREILGLSGKEKPLKSTSTGQELAQVKDREMTMEEQLDIMRERESIKKKRSQKTENRKKQREIRRMQLHMTTSSDIGNSQDGVNGMENMFRLTDMHDSGTSREGTALKTETSQQMYESEPDLSESDVELADNLEHELDKQYRQYEERKAQADSKYQAKKARRLRFGDSEFEGISEDDVPEGKEDSQIMDDDSSDEIDINGNHDSIAQPTPSCVRDQSLTWRASAFFQQDIFKDIGFERNAEPKSTHENSSSTLSLPSEHLLQGSHEIDPDALTTKNGAGKEGLRKLASEPVVSPSKKRGMNPISQTEDQQNGGGFELAPSQQDNDADHPQQRKAVRSNIDIITAEAMTLAQQIASGRRTAHDLLDEAFNKYSLRDTIGLPDWFLDDESRHSKVQRPVTAAGASAIKDKLRALNARPIKKVREAKDRKKYRAAQKIEKLRKKSALMAEDDAMSEKDKAANISKMLRRAAKKKPKAQPKLVVAKGGNKGISGRPRGVKGKYKIVDSRLKKDTRALARIAKKRR